MKDLFWTDSEENVSFLPPDGTFKDKPPTSLLVHAWCRLGYLDKLQRFLERDLPCLSQEDRQSFCSHPGGGASEGADNQCGDIPCTLSMLKYGRAAAKCRQAQIFAYLWDTYLRPRNITAIPWDCLRLAALHGDIPLAKTFWEREKNCFTRSEPTGNLDSNSSSDSMPEMVVNKQLETAVRHDNLSYIDFMLAHGLDINAGIAYVSRQQTAKISKADLLKVVSNGAVEDDEAILERVRFLVSRGMIVNW